MVGAAIASATSARYSSRDTSTAPSVRDASKVAVVALVDLMREGGGRLVDVQWTTDHLRTLGAVDVSREEYLALVADAIAAPTMTWFG